MDLALVISLTTLSTLVILLGLLIYCYRFRKVYRNFRDQSELLTSIKEMKRGNHDGVAVENIKVNHPSSECEEGVVINECLTCSLIQMGSSLAYGDNSCPHCGANTTVRFT